MTSSNRGFTLIELMIVVVIIGILTALAIPRFNMSAHQSKQKEADVLLKQVYSTQRAYFSHYGVYAANATDLVQVGFEAPTNLQWHTWTGNVALPLCLASNDAIRPGREIDGDGVITNC